MNQFAPSAARLKRVTILQRRPAAQSFQSHYSINFDEPALEGFLSVKLRRISNRYERSKDFEAVKWEA
jgi:hypothetical protein